MGKLIAAINMTLDGYFDHTAVAPDEEVHQHYADLLNEADLILYGRITFELMKYWQELVKNPSGVKTMDDFALAMDRIPKLVFSHTLKDPAWDTARLADGPLEEVVSKLKQNSTDRILVGSRGLIMQLLNLNLIDEYQICVHPVVAGAGRLLFEGVTEPHVFKLVRTKTMGSGAVVHYYSPGV